MIKSNFLKWRRAILKIIVPEFIWPKLVEIDGVNFKIRGVPYSFGTKSILKTGNYEVAERKILGDILKDGHVVVEMGGSIGILTAIISDRVGKDGFVYSVEASKAITNYSQGWLESKGNIVVMNGFGFPIWKNRGIKITGFDESKGSLGGTLSFESVIENVDSLSIYDIDNIDLEFIFKKFGKYPDVLVVDIEGSERIILEQQPHFPNSIKFILIELHPGIYGYSYRNNIVEVIEMEGFVVKRIEGDVYLFTRN